MKKIIIINILTLLLLGSSCKDYFDVNVDPNNPTEVSPNLILPVAQMYTAVYVQDDRGLSHLGNMMMYNWSEAYGFSWYRQEFLYNVNTTFYQTLFDRAYTRAMKQYTELEKLDQKYDYYKAIGIIMNSYHYQILVDLYGDIPYFNALQRAAAPTVEYDNARVVYDDLIVKLTEAINLIETTKENPVAILPGDDDAMFGGNMEEWIRFANTVKLRILVRMSDVADVSSQIAAITAQGSGYITDDVQINPGYIKEANKQNPLWDAFGQNPTGSTTLTGQATCATQWILDYLTSRNDPRIDSLYEHPSTGHLGVDQGLEVGDDYATSLVSNIGPGILKSATQGAVIFTLAESYFNQAEAALKGYVSGNPETLFNNGVAASFNYLGVAGVNTYLAQNLQNVNYDYSINKLEAIITQKWLAVNGITAEQSWFDYSRTGYPVGLPISHRASTADRPVRLFYPASELNSNSENVPKPQPNAFTAKIFWAN